MTAEQFPPQQPEPETVDTATNLRAVDEAGLCVESVTRQLVPPQLTNESPQVPIEQDPDAWDRLFARRRAAGLGTISNMTTGYTRPQGRAQRGKRG